MGSTRRVGWLVSGLCMLMLTTLMAAPVPANEPVDAASAGNPLAFDIATIKRGRQFYTVHCIRCHGADGRGDTEMREFLKTAPADLSDGEWLYGGEDRAVFDVIARGRTVRDMPAYSAELEEEEIWQVVSYLRYLGGKRP